MNRRTKKKFIPLDLGDSDVVTERIMLPDKTFATVTKLVKKKKQPVLPPLEYDYQSLVYEDLPEEESNDDEEFNKMKDDLEKLFQDHFQINGDSTEGIFASPDPIESDPNMLQLLENNNDVGPNWDTKSNFEEVPFSPTPKPSTSSYIPVCNNSQEFEPKMLQLLEDEKDVEPKWETKINFEDVEFTPAQRPSNSTSDIVGDNITIRDDKLSLTVTKIKSLTEADEPVEECGEISELINCRESNVNAIPNSGNKQVCHYSRSNIVHVIIDSYQIHLALEKNSNTVCFLFSEFANKFITKLNPALLRILMLSSDAVLLFAQIEGKTIRKSGDSCEICEKLDKVKRVELISLLEVEKFLEIVDPKEHQIIINMINYLMQCYTPHHSIWLEDGSQNV